MIKIRELYDLSHTLARDYLSGFTYPWEALKGIKEFILTLGPTLDKSQYEETAPEVWVHRTAKIAPTAYLGPPCIIGAGTEVRHCAFIRGAALIGENCVVGNSAELKDGRDAGRLRRGGVQQRAQPRDDRRPAFQHLPVVLRSGRGTCRYDMENRRRYGKERIKKD